jgi:hypothetical protein
MARDHGFTIREVDAVVRPVVGRTPFADLHVTRTGSMLRLELVRWKPTSLVTKCPLEN